MWNLYLPMHQITRLLLMIMSDNGQADNKSDETIPAPKTDDSTSKYAWNNTIIIIIGICIILIVFGAVFYVRKKSGSEEE